ncbi:MAG: hypothetical protein JOZ78_17455 [Chroococcidiopsidaceae cyanobacterium CP_BM_ER_R8_30]|nr:hypothetical protein [Chroococcidiopsidaceae cyanobacterium CP_BM_ER_R8_30]
MTSSSESITNQEILNRLDRLDERLGKLDDDVNAMKVKQIAVNTRIDAYQKASNQVVNLAFALISAATVIVIVSAVLGR